jgi:mannan endo-1,4-beta-mannosidase
MSAHLHLFGNGVNLQPSYYNNGNVTFGWDLMHKYVQIKTLRIEIEPDKVDAGKEWIAEAVNQGFDVIATYHKYAALGSDEELELMKAAHWWADNYSYLTEGMDGLFMINLMNEFGSHELKAPEFAHMYNEAISVIRSGSGFEGAIIVDLPGYGQEADVAADASALLNDCNLILSMHVYPDGWNSVEERHLSTSDIDTMAASGRPCIIGEFGTDGGSPGGVDVAAVVSYASGLGWPVLGWAWNGDGGKMNMVSPPWLENATAESYQESNYFASIIALL